ncbi:MAG TPA: putative lipid II flippase FtsW [Candidatus Binatia bacterium]
MSWRTSEARSIEAALALPPVAVRMSDRPDPWVVALVSMLTVLGLIFVFDASTFVSNYHFGDGYRMIIKHAVSATVGMLLLWVCSRCPSDFLKRRAYWLFAASLPLVLATLVPHIGISVNGAKRWIPFGLFNLQPSEFIKITYVIVVAAWLDKVADRARNPLYTMVPVLGALGIVAVILLGQPDFGTTALLAGIAVLMLMLGGVPKWQLFVPATLLGGAGFALIWTSEYRWNRVMAFLDPEKDPLGAGYHLLQALTAFGSGGVWGTGIGASTSKSGYLPEPHTDFIFSVIGEETGLIGGITIVVLFGLLAWRGFRIAHRHSEPFAQLLAAGLTLVIVLQAILNIGVVLGVLPTKGIGLPFISYGGSSIMAFLAIGGLLLSLSRELRER